MGWFAGSNICKVNTVNKASLKNAAKRGLSLLAVCVRQETRRCSSCSSFMQLVGRERRLDGALMQSGKFADALESLMTWLSDAEQLVLTNVKPLSPDYKLLKTQMQEQKVRDVSIRYTRYVLYNYPVMRSFQE